MNKQMILPSVRRLHISVCRPSVKPGHDYERLKLQCMKAMSDLQSLQNQHTKTLKRCEEAARDTDYYQ